MSGDVELTPELGCASRNTWIEGRPGHPRRSRERPDVSRGLRPRLGFRALVRGCQAAHALLFGALPAPVERERNRPQAPRARNPEKTGARNHAGYLLREADREPPPPKPKQHLFADLASLWKNGLKPEVPTIARVNEELALFYTGRINEMHAEPGVGKTNVAMTAVILS